MTSGIRSALVAPGTQSGAWLRLKGCGNHYDGFPTRIVRDDHGKAVTVAGGELVEIRGSCFRHTVASELYSCHQLASTLKSEGIDIGNTPVGCFQYAASACSEFPDVPLYCGVYQTLGDRRLADHVLRGLELLLPSLVDAGDVSRMLPLFPIGAFGPRPTVPEVGFDEADSTFMQYACGDQHAASNLADFASHRLRLHAPSVELLHRAEDPAVQTLWHRACQALSVLVGTGVETDVLGYLYWRLGWECGHVLRILAAHGVSWGTFRDVTGTHCNAHGNNFVLRLPNPSGLLLAPVDFDLAYTADSYVASRDADADRAEARSNIDLERHALALDIAGSRDSTGTRNDHAVPAPYDALRWGLRDTAVRAYVLSVHGQPDQHPHQESIEPLCRALLELAILMTWDVTA